MVAAELNYSYETLMDMEFRELLTVWYPQACKIFQQREKMRVNGLLKGLFGGK